MGCHGFIAAVVGECRRKREAGRQTWGTPGRYGLLAAGRRYGEPVWPLESLRSMSGRGWGRRERPTAAEGLWLLETPEDVDCHHWMGAEMSGCSPPVAEQEAAKSTSVSRGGVEKFEGWRTRDILRAATGNEEWRLAGRSTERSPSGRLRRPLRLEDSLKKAEILGGEDSSSKSSPFDLQELRGRGNFSLQLSKVCCNRPCGTCCNRPCRIFVGACRL
ncbi:hypothetical protein MLD38_025537 [Melastoma candidum]|uniref:Uncharacterized protein n=1 Tax=Melastoma candidum TaxID=119954 RepID=A0ACB9NYK3_9MYRT|nr:hypothetical protein MLD38_025537 [Melastoma candidum]